jgi:EmrB/QacA subfamily drug resistance transporter
MTRANGLDALQGPNGRRKRLIVLGICSLSLFMVTLDNTIVNVALPSLQRQFHASVSELQWVVDAYLLVLAALLLLAGSLGDRFGRRRVLRTGLLLFGIGSLACSLSVSLPMLIGFRMLQACGGCMLNPNSLSIISNTFRDPKERAGAIGFWGGVVGISTAAGPVIGGGLIEAVDWRAIFWVNVPVVLAALVLLSMFVPESRADRPRPLDPPGQLLAIVLLGSLTYGIIEGPSRGWTSGLILACFGVVVASLTAFVLVELRQAEPLLQLHFFKSPPFAGASAIATLAFFVLAGWLFLNTLYLQEVRGYSPLMAGVAALPATVVIVVVSPFTGRVVGRRGSRLPLGVAGLLMMAASALLVLVQPRSSYLFLAVCYLLVGFGFGMVNPPITNTAVSGMPMSQAGVAAAVAGTARQVGSVLGVAVLGSVVASRMHGQLASRLAASHLPAALQAKARSMNLSAGLSGTGMPASVNKVIGEAFTAATHTGWAVASGCGLLITVVALLTTGPRSQEKARQVMQDTRAR